MGITISNSSFKVNNSVFKSAVPITKGIIYRVSNIFGTDDSLTYVRVNRTTAVNINVNSGSIAYIMAASGSLQQNVTSGVLGQLCVSVLFISSSSDENPTFTEQVITTVGSGSWTKPLGVTQVIVECWGGGGAGGGATLDGSAGAGGGGGQYVRKLFTYGTASQSIPYVVGAGGVGGIGNGPSGSSTTWNSTDVVALPGAGGIANAILDQESQGGIGGGGIQGLSEVILTENSSSCFGGSGGNGTVVFDPNISAIAAYPGAGGGGAGSVQVGNSSFYSQLPFFFSLEYGGQAGDGNFWDTGGGNGFSATEFTSGGGGAGRISGPSRSGGNGAQGLIRLIYR